MEKISNSSAQAYTQKDDAQVSASGLPESMLAAMSSAAQELASEEMWTTKGGAVSSVTSHIMALALASVNILDKDKPARQMVRQNLMRVIAYMPSDLRLCILIDLARRNPEAIDDLFSGRIDQKYEIFRYNLLSSLGVFARHGLIEEVFTQERITRVGKVLEQTKKKHGSTSRGKK